MDIMALLRQTEHDLKELVSLAGWMGEVYPTAPPEIQSMIKRGAPQLAEEFNIQKDKLELLSHLMGKKFSEN